MLQLILRLQLLFLLLFNQLMNESLDSQQKGAFGEAWLPMVDNFREQLKLEAAIIFLGTLSSLFLLLSLPLGAVPRD